MRRGEVSAVLPVIRNHGRVTSGEILTVGRRQDGTLIVAYPDNTKITQPKTVWKMPGHNAGEYGSKLVTSLLPGRKFPFPKALYAVEDILRFFVVNKPNAVVLDFFSGSGTTCSCGDAFESAG